MAAGKRRRIFSKVVRFGGGGRLLGLIPFVVLLFFGVAMLLVAAYLDLILTREMDGRRWNLSTRLYPDAWAIRPCDPFGPEDVERRLQRLSYGASPAASAAAGASSGVHRFLMTGWGFRDNELLVGSDSSRRE